MTMAQIICCIFFRIHREKIFYFFSWILFRTFLKTIKLIVSQNLFYELLFYIRFFLAHYPHYTIGIVEAICTRANESRFFVHYCNFTFIAIDFFANWRDFATLKLHLRDYCDFNFHFCFHALF